jgi:hypothetical protein
MEKHIRISTKEIEEYLFECLIRLGYAPSKDEMDDLADIIFQFIVDFLGAEEEFPND